MRRRFATLSTSAREKYECLLTARPSDETYGTMNEAIDLTTCEHEPITIPGSIQPHGLLLVLRGIGLTVVQASANSPLFLDAEPSEMLGRPVSRWFDQA